MYKAKLNAYNYVTLCPLVINPFSHNLLQMQLNYLRYLEYFNTVNYYLCVYSI